MDHSILFPFIYLYISFYVWINQLCRLPFGSYVTSNNITAHFHTFAISNNSKNTKRETFLNQALTSFAKFTCGMKKKRKKEFIKGEGKSICIIMA